MSIFHLDYETTSAADIKSVGAYRYACDPSTRILMFAIARDDWPPLVWRFDTPDSDESKRAWTMLCGMPRDGIICAHNAQFEIAISRYRLLADVGLNPPAIEQWRCTQAMCRRAAIPPGLADAAAFLQLGDQKDPVGKALITIFSNQNKLVTLSLGKQRRKSASPVLESPVPWDWTMTVGGRTMTVREAWDAFISYCRQDVIVERQVHKALAKFELTGAELDGFQFDLRMNARGVPVNIPALRHAGGIVSTHQGALTKEFERVTCTNESKAVVNTWDGSVVTTTQTGLQPSQTAKVLEWLRERGYRAHDLQAATIEGVIAQGCIGMSPIAQRALTIRSELSFAAIKKIPAMLNTVCQDGRMRGLFTWYGAQRTGRWTSGGPQLQNAKKPTIKNPDVAYLDICDGLDFEMFKFFHGNPYESVASVIRNFVQPHDGLLLDCDYSNIESRVAAWIAGQADLLNAYREGRDPYKELAAAVFGVAVSDVTKEQRFVGKVGNLSLVFQTGAKTFHETCAAWGMPIDKKLACRTVKTFRETNDQFPITWRRFEAAASKAMKDAGTWHAANELVSFGYSNKKPFPRLLMKLPSGRCLVHPLPEIKRTTKFHTDYETGESREWESDELSFYGQNQTSVQWGRVTTYAGSLFQSSVQATARDLMQHGCVRAERSGYKIFALIHDEALAEDGELAGFEKALCTHPDWLPKDFPLAAEGGVVPYYTK